MRSKFFQKIFYNWQAKIISFLLAVLVYFILMFSIQNSRTITLPVEVVMPDGYVAISIVPKSIDLVIQGTEDQIYMIDVSNITLKLDFSKVDPKMVKKVYNEKEKREEYKYTAPVQIDFSDLDSYVDMSAVSFYTKPSQFPVQFTKSATGETE